MDLPWKQKKTLFIHGRIAGERRSPTNSEMDTKAKATKEERDSTHISSCKVAQPRIISPAWYQLAAVATPQDCLRSHRLESFLKVFFTNQCSLCILGLQNSGISFSFIFSCVCTRDRAASNDQSRAVIRLNHFEEPISTFGCWLETVWYASAFLGVHELSTNCRRELMVGSLFLMCQSCENRNLHQFQFLWKREALHLFFWCDRRGHRLLWYGIVFNRSCGLMWFQQKLLFWWQF